MDYDILYYYTTLLDQYIEAILTYGLTEVDFKEIGKVLRILEKYRHGAAYSLEKYIHNNHYLENCHDKIPFRKVSITFSEEYLIEKSQLQEDFESIRNLKNNFDYIYESLKATVADTSLEDYLQDICSITHLLYTNNIYPKVRPCSMSSFMFSCQFHNERTPSLSINNTRNIGFCYGCGISFNVINYLEYYEGLTKEEVISLLSRIYLIDIEGNIIDQDNHLIHKYQKTLLDDNFMDLLNKGYNRTKLKEDSYEKDKALKKVEAIFKTIERVKNNEHIKYDETTSKPKQYSFTIKY